MLLLCETRTKRSVELYRSKNLDPSPGPQWAAKGQNCFPCALIFPVTLDAKKLNSISYESPLSALQNTYLSIIKNPLYKKVLSKILKFLFCHALYLLPTVHPLLRQTVTDITTESKFIILFRVVTSNSSYIVFHI